MTSITMMNGTSIKPLLEANVKSIILMLLSAKKQ